MITPHLLQTWGAAFLHANWAMMAFSLAGHTPKPTEGMVNHTDGPSVDQTLPQLTIKVTHQGEPIEHSCI